MAARLPAGDRVEMSWDDFQAVGDAVRAEYIDGTLVMAAAPTMRHQRISFRLARLLDDALPDGVEVVEACAWKPDADEFVPDLMVIDQAEEDVRYTGVPHLVVEILSTDPASDMVRKAAKYAAAGLERYWVVEPEGPEIIVHEPRRGVMVERVRHGPGTEVILDVGVASVALDPAVLPIRGRPGR